MLIPNLVPVYVFMFLFENDIVVTSGTLLASGSGRFILPLQSPRHLYVVSRIGLNVFLTVHHELTIQ